MQASLKIHLVHYSEQYGAWMQENFHFSEPSHGFERVAQVLRETSQEKNGNWGIIIAKPKGPVTTQLLGIQLGDITNLFAFR